MIRSEAENETTLLQIEALMDKGDRRGPEEDRLLELLARLAADFEAAKYDFHPRAERRSGVPPKRRDTIAGS